MYGLSVLLPLTIHPPSSPPSCPRFILLFLHIPSSLQHFAPSLILLLLFSYPLPPSLFLLSPSLPDSLLFCCGSMLNALPLPLPRYFSLDTLFILLSQLRVIFLLLHFHCIFFVPLVFFSVYFILRMEICASAIDIAFLPLRANGMMQNQCKTSPDPSTQRKRLVRHVSSYHEAIRIRV